MKHFLNALSIVLPPAAKVAVVLLFCSFLMPTASADVVGFTGTFAPLDFGGLGVTLDTSNAPDAITISRTEELGAGGGLIFSVEEDKDISFDFDFTVGAGDSASFIVAVTSAEENPDDGGLFTIADSTSTGAFEIPVSAGQDFFVGVLFGNIDSLGGTSVTVSNFVAARAIPEPSSSAVLVLIFGLGAFRRRK